LHSAHKKKGASSALFSLFVILNEESGELPDSQPKDP
jgi:hypothetical protein